MLQPPISQYDNFDQSYFFESKVSNMRTKSDNIFSYLDNEFIKESDQALNNKLDIRNDKLNVKLNNNIPAIYKDGRKLLEKNIDTLVVNRPVCQNNKIKQIDEKNIFPVDNTINNINKRASLNVIQTDDVYTINRNPNVRKTLNVKHPSILNDLNNSYQMPVSQYIKRNNIINNLQTTKVSPEIFAYITSNKNRNIIKNNLNPDILSYQLNVIQQNINLENNYITKYEDIISDSNYSFNNQRQTKLFKKLDEYKQAINNYLAPIQLINNSHQLSDKIKEYKKDILNEERGISRFFDNSSLRQNIKNSTKFNTLTYSNIDILNTFQALRKQNKLTSNFTSLTNNIFTFQALKNIRNTFTQQKFNFDKYNTIRSVLNYDNQLIKNVVDFNKTFHKYKNSTQPLNIISKYRNTPKYLIQINKEQPNKYSLPQFDSTKLKYSTNNKQLILQQIGNATSLAMSSSKISNRPTIISNYEKSSNEVNIMKNTYLLPMGVQQAKLQINVPENNINQITSENKVRYNIPQQNMEIKGYRTDINTFREINDLPEPLNKRIELFNS